MHLWTYSCSEGPDQTAVSMIRFFAARLQYEWTVEYNDIQQGPRLDNMDLPADLDLYCLHIPQRHLFLWFSCHKIYSQSSWRIFKSQMEYMHFPSSFLNARPDILFKLSLKEWNEMSSPVFRDEGQKIIFMVNIQILYIPPDKSYYPENKTLISPSKMYVVSNHK